MSLTTSSNIPQLRNGDQVIGFMKAQDLKNRGGYQDWASLHTWYQEDPLKNHMKLQTFFGMQSPQRYPIYNELLSNKAVLEVNGWEGKFTYDIPVEQVDKMITVADMSHQDFPGIDGTTFKIVINEELAPGTTLTQDAMFGMELVVSESEPVRPKGDGFEHTVLLNTNDSNAYYPSNLLSKGIEYFVTGHGVAELGTRLAKVRMPKTTEYMTCEFQLGSIRGAESFVTGKADSVNLGGAVASTKDYMDKMMMEAEQLGELLVMMDVDAGGAPKKNTGRVGSVMEYLTMKELERLTANSLMFQRGGTVKDTNGTVRYNEGLWHQLRRGKIIKYGRKGGITKEHIKEAVDYVFIGNPDLPTIERKVKFKCGSAAYDNVLEIFQTEFNAQMAANAALLGADRIINNPVSGDNYNLILKPVRVVGVWLPGIGNVEVIEDMTLNRIQLADRNASGMHQNGFDHTAYSMLIWDASDSQYSNNKTMPKGAKLIEGGNKGANVYLVKPEGQFSYWGTRNGRYSSRKASDIVSSFKEMAEEYWAYNSVSVYVRDVSKFIMIELDETVRKGFN